MIASPVFGRYRRHPVEQGSRCAVVDLQREGQTGHERTESGKRTQLSKRRFRYREEPRRAAEAGRQCADQIPRRQIDAVADQQHLSGGSRIERGARGGIDEVVDKNQAAAVVDAGKRQRQPARGEADQGSEVGFDLRPINQRRAQDDELEPRLLRRRRQKPLIRQLGAPIGIAGRWRVRRAKRGSRLRHGTHRSDRAHIDQPPHPAGRGRADQCLQQRATQPRASPGRRDGSRSPCGRDAPTSRSAGRCRRSNAPQHPGLLLPDRALDREHRGRARRGHGTTHRR